MARKQRRQTFAEMVAELGEPTLGKPWTPPHGYLGGLHGSVLVDPEGVEHTEVVEVSVQRARRLASEGTRVAHDPCGCGGGCGLDWLTPDQVTAALADGVPPSFHDGDFWLWSSRSGSRVLLTSWPVRWPEPSP